MGATSHIACASKLALLSFPLHSHTRRRRRLDEEKALSRAALRPRRRRCVVPGEAGTEPHPPPLLDALRPILPLFHSLLSDADAARLLRTSRTTVLALLSGYSFNIHIFQPASVPSLCRLRDLYLTYQLPNTQLVLHLTPSWKVVGFDPARTDLSPFPSTLTRPRIGHYEVSPPKHDEQEQHWAALSAAACHWQDTEPWQLPHSHPQVQSHGREGRQWQQSPGNRLLGCLQCRLPPGLLPCGLRVLQLSCSFNRPLEPGSLPSSLTYLEFDDDFDQPLPAGVLPASLLHLTLARHYRHPLGQGSLPSLLERLILHSWLPLSAVVLPPSLRALHLWNSYEALRPDALPSTLLFLSLYHCSHPIAAEALPSSLVHLHLGVGAYQQQLPPGMLPSSLQDLSVGAFGQPLQPPSLPEGLLFLRLRSHMSDIPPLPSGALPSTLLGLDLGDRCRYSSLSRRRSHTACSG